MSHDHLYMQMLKDIDRLFSQRTPAAIGSNCSKPSLAPHAKNDCAGNDLAAGLQRPDCLDCNDSGRRIHDGCYTLLRCWCVAGDRYELQQELSL